MAHYENAELPPTPHPEKPSGKTTWHGSGEFMKYNRWGRNPNKDADFAAETAELTRIQILQQAGVSVLSQAYAQPQLVLALLQ